MTGLDHERQQLVVTQIAEDAAVSDTVAPEGTEPGVSQRPSDLTWILEQGNPVAQVVSDSKRAGQSRLPDLSGRAFGDFNSPGQGSGPARRARGCARRLCDVQSLPARRYTGPRGAARSLRECRTSRCILFTCRRLQVVSGRRTAACFMGRASLRWCHSVLAHQQWVCAGKGAKCPHELCHGPWPSACSLMRHSRTTPGEGRAADIEPVDDLGDERLES